MFQNGKMWYDDKGEPIQAHGGMILNYQEVWYWYGENKGQANNPNKTRVDVIGISCYSSKDLQSWHYEGLVLDVKNSPKESIMQPQNVCERPKVLYNEKTNKFVMWVHIDTPDYSYAGVAVAISDSPKGPFSIIKEKRPNGQDSRDMTLFVDKDKKGYLIHSSNWNKTLHIARLTDDYMDVDGFYTSALIEQEREAPAIVYEQEMYYMVTSGCTGWRYNSALYAVSSYVNGQWKLIDNPCEGEESRNTFKGQSTWIFRVNGQIYLMLDHWIPENLRESGYSILPITIKDGVMTVKWTDKFEYGGYYESK
jgi:hypothetical protein